MAPVREIGFSAGMSGHHRCYLDTKHCTEVVPNRTPTSAKQSHAQVLSFAGVDGCTYSYCAYTPVSLLSRPYTVGGSRHAESEGASAGPAAWIKARPVFGTPCWNTAATAPSC